MNQKPKHTETSPSSYDAAAYGYDYRYDGFGGSAQASHGVALSRALTEQLYYTSTMLSTGFGARYYMSDLSVWLSVDPLSNMYPSTSAYMYCLGNPVMLIDPDGRNASPVVDKNGDLLGTDSEGWTGEVIVMDKDDFEQGMDHDVAVDKGTELSKHGEGIKITDKTWDKIDENGGDIMTPYVRNNSGATAYYKPEGNIDSDGDGKPDYENSGAYPIAPNTDLYVPVDGVATKKYNDHVFKIPNGGTVLITSEGGINLDFYGFGGMGRAAPGIGWINKEYIESEDKNDRSWDALFDKAKKIGKIKY